MSAENAIFGFEDDEDFVSMDEGAVAARETLHGDFLSVFNGGPQSDRVLTYLAGYCRQVRTCFVAGQPDATSFYEGRRDVYLEILRWLEMDDRELLNRAKQQSLHRGDT